MDSDPVWQQRMAALIDAEPDMNISHIASNKESAIRASNQLDLDVMVLDLALHSSQQDGLDTIVEVVKIKTLPIIILTSLYEPEIIVDAVLAGAINYITKINYMDVASAVKEAYQEQSSLHGDVASIIRNAIGLVNTQPVIRELLI